MSTTTANEDALGRSLFVERALTSAASLVRALWKVQGQDLTREDTRLLAGPLIGSLDRLLELCIDGPGQESGTSMRTTDTTPPAGKVAVPNFYLPLGHGDRIIGVDRHNPKRVGFWEVDRPGITGQPLEEAADSPSLTGHHIGLEFDGPEAETSALVLIAAIMDAVGLDEVDGKVDRYRLSENAGEEGGAS